jgi:ribosome-binding factor A
MTEIRRADRVARLLLAEISQLVYRDVRDPRVRNVTITRVDVTDDLRQATVWFTPLGGLGDEKRIAELQAGLDKAKLFVQGKVGRNLRLRVTPRLKFLYDAGVDNLVRMHEVLGGLRSDGAMGEDAAETPSAEEDDDGSST